MNPKVKLAAAAIGLLIASVYAIQKSRSAKLGASGNNGYLNEMMRPPSPELRKTMERAMERPRPAGDPMDPAQMEKMQTEFAKELPANQRAEFQKMNEEMRKRMERTRAALSPEQQMQLFSQMSRVFMNQRRPGGRPAPGGGDGGSGR